MKKKSVFIVVGVILVVMLGILFIRSANCPPDNPLYNKGDYVKHVLDGRVGIVTYVTAMPSYTPHLYSVTFSNPPGTALSPYTEMECRENELESAERPGHLTSIAEKK